MSNKQSQKGGDSSTNIQAQGDVIIGLSYSDVRAIAMDVFKTNFTELRSIAQQVATERAEALVDSFLDAVAREGQKEIPEAENPDFQYVLFSAQRDYARTGDQDLGDLLVQLLVDRTKTRDRDLLQIVLNQSLTVAPMLTPDQLDALSLAFLVRYTINDGLGDIFNDPVNLRLSTVSSMLGEYLDQAHLQFVPGASRKHSSYQHLEYAGCGSIAMGKLTVEQIVLKSYGGFVCKGFAEEATRDLTLTPEAKKQLLIPSLHEDSLVQVRALNEQHIDSLCEHLKVEPDSTARLKQLQTEGLMSRTELKDFLVSLRPQMADLFQVWDDTMIKSLNLTTVGIAIAHANMKRRIGSSPDLSIWI